MSVAIKIPTAGESVSEVQIGEWKKGEGEHIERDEVLVDIETDKASMELPAPVTGTLERIVHAAGEFVPVGEVIAYVNGVEDGQAETEAATPQAAAAAEHARENPRGDDERAHTNSPGPAMQRAHRAEATTAEESTGAEHDREKPTEERRWSAPSDARAQTSQADRSASQNEDVPRRDEAVETIPTTQAPTEVQPRVRPQFRAHADKGPPVQSEEVGRRSPASENKAVTAATGQHALARQRAEPSIKAPPRPERVVPMSAVRRRIAQRLTEAVQTTAMLTTFNEADMTEVLRLRKEHGPQFQEHHGIKLGLMSFFVKAAVAALRRVPEVNAAIRDSQIVLRDYCDMGIAVSTDQGLLVPVLRNAERMSFAEIEEAIADLSRRARERRIAVDEMVGGTFTITNGGVFGSLLSTPILNPPQSGILGLHAIQERPVARDAQVVIRPMMYLALTYDHRLMDGKEAVTFLRHVKETIESPMRLLLDS